MKEKEYIELQNLLSILRVETLKRLGDNNLTMTERDRNIKVLRATDILRYKVTVEIEEQNQNKEPKIGFDTGGKQWKNICLGGCVDQYYYGL